MNHQTLCLTLLTLLLAPLAASAELGITHTQRFAVEEGDTVEGVAFDAEGGLYVAGMRRKAFKPGDAVHTAGKRAEDSRYGVGFVARLDAKGKPVTVFQLAPGLAHLTTVAVNETGVYVGGYAVPEAVAVFKHAEGFSTRATKDPRQTPHAVPRDHYTDDRFNPMRDGRGVPVVLRLSHDLKTVEAGTTLEGWQSVWHVPWPLREDRWQPVGLALVDGGDIVVTHDGGYVLDPGEGKKPEAEHFFHVADYVSRLSGDLKVRRWKKDLYTPRIERERASRIMRQDWPFDTLGNTRTLRTRTDGTHIYLAGWSPTQTSSEPWWSPFLFKMDGEGEFVWRAYNPDPQSGRGERMNGLVSDAAVRSVAVDAQGDVLFAGIGDGGNSVLMHDPRDYNKAVDTMRGSPWGFGGRTLFWGTAGRLDGEDPALEAGAVILGRHRNKVAAGWPVDLSAFGEDVLVIGRQTLGFPFSKDAAHTDENCGFVTLYNEKFSGRYTSALPGIKPMTLAVHGDKAIVVGEAIDEDGVDVVILERATPNAD